MGNFRFLFVLVGTLASQLPLAAAPARTWMTNEGYSLILPEGWRDIPWAMRRKLAKVNARHAWLDVTAQTVVFEPLDWRDPLDVPLLAVSILDSPRLYEGTLVRMTNVALLRSVLAKSMWLDGIWEKDLRRVEYDTNKQALTLEYIRRMERDSDRVLSRLFVTDEGAIRFDCIVSDKEFDQLREVFFRMLDSVVLDERIKYKRRIPADFSNGYKDWLFVGGFIGVGILVILGGTYWLRVRGPSTLDY